jgi:hypothetical protein
MRDAHSGPLRPVRRACSMCAACQKGRGPACTTAAFTGDGVMKRTQISFGLDCAVNYVGFDAKGFLSLERIDSFDFGDGLKLRPAAPHHSEFRDRCTRPSLWRPRSPRCCR